MNYSKEFEELIENSIKKNQYVGLGNPNAKILFIGKEAGVPIGTTITHGSANSWKEKTNDYSKRFVPVEKNVRNHNHTWQKYEKVYNQIIAKLEKTKPKKEDYEITFVENVFTTELSNLVAPTTNEAKQLDGFKFELKKRKEHFWKSEFIQKFPIVLITATDNNYIETYEGEVCELFNVEYDKKIDCAKSDKMWIHYSKSKNPKLVIHTRQLTNGASKELLDQISEVIADFINENSIKI
ncbi:hypothetical protein CW731_05650 [Polaribacter sp. ALD11]|uniref:hypothetical protein n=1 Tax=Polaribacter sp. ALD11 TaxID=2058137 RepID=UPI000C3124D5|nr:hypothetical protein [Polaribacter sp. ALD11]AUC84807.1 hypothetical protein CW731_05650 [Polaribacter sp. ALD11]